VFIVSTAEIDSLGGTISMQAPSLPYPLIDCNHYGLNFWWRSDGVYSPEVAVNSHHNRPTQRMKKEWPVQNLTKSCFRIHFHDWRGIISCRLKRWPRNHRVVTSQFEICGSPPVSEGKPQKLKLRNYSYGMKVTNMEFSRKFLQESSEIISRFDLSVIERSVEILAATRARKARLFILGVGGSAANASHAVNDFRKIAGIEAYAPTDNVSELTARTNDEGWATVFENWLRVSQLRSDDTVMVFSVGGGNIDKQVSPNLVEALKYARQVGARIIGIVGRDGGYTAQVADACVVIPTVNPLHVTPHSEAFQAVIWHLMVSHPALKATETKWESVR
jgi:D-sedoheptulose 7-phosphate isomerase